MLSPALFNIFKSLPTPADTDTHQASYADDLTIYTQHTDPGGWNSDYINSGTMVKRQQN